MRSMPEGKTPIRRLGSILDVDEEGYIVKAASIDKIQPKWQPAVDEAVEAYKNHLSDSLHSVYVRGSVAKGEAMDNISDIDTMALVTMANHEIDTGWVTGFEHSLVNKFPFVNGVEIKAVHMDCLDHKTQFMLKTQAVCVYGEDITETLPKMKPGLDAVNHAFLLGKRIDQTVESLKNTNDATHIQQNCTWIMKRIVRTGCELVMERSQKYTRDLYPCYELFAGYYPDKSDDMYRALELAINPTEDKQEVLSVLADFGGWITHEVGRVFQE